MSTALVVQRIEQIRPKDEMEVRFLPRAHIGQPGGVSADSGGVWDMSGTNDMHGESLRLRKVNELIGQRLSAIILRTVDWKPGVFVTVAKVKTSADLRQTHVAVSVFPFSEAEYAIRTLGKEMHAIQRLLHADLHMRPLPKVVFEIDTTEDRAQVVEDILRKPDF